MGRDSDKDADTVRQRPKATGATPLANDDTAVAAPQRVTPVAPALPSPLEAAAPSFSRGDFIDNFRVVEKLGEGGMGIVLKAYDPDLDRHVAIKVLQPQLYRGVGSSDARDRMLREAKAMAKVRHANVITVYSVGTVRNQVYIAMEYIAGGTLREWSDAGSRSWGEVVATYIKAGHGLSAAHKAGLVHRDFKPANVLMDEDGRVLVTDFGLVSSDSLPSHIRGRPRNSIEMPAAQPLSVSLTQTGTILGTPPYMAPEQHCGDPADSRADQFAFCVSLYEALYGERPHEGGDYSVLAGNILSGDIRDAPLGSSVPTWLREIVLRGLSVNAPERFESMDALLEALGTEPVQPKASWRGRRAAAAITACIVGLVVAFAWPRSKPAAKNSTPPSAEAPTFVSAATLSPLDSEAAPATVQGVMLITSVPPQIELYREDNGEFFGTTPFFGFAYPLERKLLPGDCSLKLVAKHTGYIDTSALHSACGRMSSSTVRLTPKPGEAQGTRPVIRDSQPCTSERRELSDALEGDDVDRVSQAWADVSQCYFQVGRLEEAAYAMDSVSSVYEYNNWMPQDAKRKKSADEGALAFRMAQVFWNRKESHQSLMKARAALHHFRFAKRDDDEKRVEDWINKRGSLSDLRMQIEGMPDNAEQVTCVAIPGKVEPPASLSEAMAFPVKEIMLSSGYVDSSLVLEEYPEGKHTVCIEANDGSLAESFGCRVVQHGNQGSKSITIAITAVQGSPTSNSPASDVDVFIHTEPSGGKLSIDDRFAGTDGLTIIRRRGTRFTVGCQLKGYLDGSVQVVFDGQKKSFQCKMRKK